MKILLVEDDKMLQLAIIHSMEQEGHKILLAADGNTAMQFMKQETFDVLICDLLIPETSGPAFLHLLQNLYENKVPVIAISSLNDGKSLLAKSNVLVNSFLHKPFKMDELIKIINSLN